MECPIHVSDTTLANKSSLFLWSRGFTNSRFRRVMNDIIRLSVRYVPAHLASRSSNSRQGLLFSPRPTPSSFSSSSSSTVLISVDPTYLRNEQRLLLHSGGRVPRSRNNSRDYTHDCRHSSTALRSVVTYLGPSVREREGRRERKMLVYRVSKSIHLFNLPKLMSKSVTQIYW